MKVSVAMATYNGAAYIKKQISSILEQELSVDEIVISDDGSQDNTLELIKEFQDERIKLYTDNKKHGFVGNFEHALTKCTGDIIFLADQDDVWSPDKVKKIVEVFEQVPSAKLVFSNGDIIGKRNEIIQDNLIELEGFDKGLSKVSRAEWLERAIMRPFVYGMAMCISKELLVNSLPFPEKGGGHDRWLLLNALCLEECYYLNENLVHYRLHGENTVGNQVYKGNIIQKIRRKIEKIRNVKKHTGAFDLNYCYAKDSKRVLEQYELNETDAYGVVKRICEIGDKEMDALNSNRFIGAIKLITLFCKDRRYRKNGKKEFVYKFLAVLFH